jgi:hypothetical protein
MTAYTTAAETQRPFEGPARRRTFDQEIARLVDLTRPCDVLRELRGLDGIATRWVDAIRRVAMRDVTEFEVMFQSGHVQGANDDMVRVFCAYMLAIAAECLPLHGGKHWRSFSRYLYRGKQHRWVVDENGEFDREYVPARSQGGLAGRLGVSVRTLDLYNRIARAAGFFTTRQIKGKESVAKLPKHLRGVDYSFAVYEWLMEVPRAIADRVRGRARAADAAPVVETPPVRRTTPPTAAESAEADALVAETLLRLRRAAKPPS